MLNAAVVHLGTQFPLYLIDCIEQFFLFNKSIKLYCLIENDFNELTSLQKKFSNLELVRIDKIQKSSEHKFFLTFNRRAKSTWRGGFWRFVIERFFYLQDFMKSFNIQNLIHFEYDNMIYQNIAQFESVFTKFNQIGVIADCDDRCIPGVVFIPTYKSLQNFTKFYNFHYTIFPNNDMVAFSFYLKKQPKKCFTLPVIPESYFYKNQVLKSDDGFISKNPNQYFINFSSFKLLFDAASFGQYLGGIDSRNTNKVSTKKFINEHAVYNPSDFEFYIKKTEDNLFVPIAKYNNEEYKLFNLHIHSKQLKEFRSDKEISL